MPYNVSVQTNRIPGRFAFQLLPFTIADCDQIAPHVRTYVPLFVWTTAAAHEGRFAMMDNCRICLQFRNLDNNHICKRCAIKESRKVATKIRLLLYKSTLRPESVSTGRIISKEDWFYMRRLIDNFYSSVTYEDIDWMNKEKDMERDEETKRIVSGFVYLMRADNGYYKIGRSIDVDVRNRQHMRDYPLVITVIHSFFCRNYVKAEAALLKMFSDKRLQGEWFALENQDVEFITNITDEIAQRLF